MKEKIKEFLQNLAKQNYFFKKAYTYLVEQYLHFKYKKISRQNIQSTSVATKSQIGMKFTCTLGTTAAATLNGPE